MKHLSCLLLSLLLLQNAFAQTNRVGIGTTTPRAGLDVSHNDGLVATGTVGLGNTDNLPTGAGTRLMWIPKLAAFRAGYALSAQWDLDQIGVYSVAFGYRPTASGNYSTAMGSSTIASGVYSTAMGFLTTANGDYSTAMGAFASTNEKKGSFVVGDASTFTSLLSSAEHEFSARFAGGYRLFTNAEMSVGVSLAAGGNAWSTISDSTKKEGSRPADGQSFLRKIAAMRLGSWNYRGQDQRTLRHYGPMAQDFFAAFGHDGVGTVGNDTSINGADFDGVNLIAIKALIQENETLKGEVADLRRLLSQVGADVQALKATASR